MAVDAARAKSLFLAASDLADPAERAAYLDRECGGDAELRPALEALLRANDAAPPPRPGERTVDSAPGQPETEDYGDPTARVGALLAGKYKLVEEIGEGGMGSVFMAQQTEPVRRAVAVKVIKAGMDSKAVLARFEAERQALAMMDHPNIARVLDAGTTDGGRPFFVMELVKGTPITRYCDEHKLTPRQRLELFVPVCQAIQHAHQKGIIHRDIKPSNVLVALYDDRPVPKVIDFGVAKAAGQSLTDKTLMTGFGAIVGTPEYMSPEQASLNNLDIDTRSDVYSLGVLLYELLTGTTPVDKKSLGKAALLEILRIVREVEAPRPSARLCTIDTLPSVAANRGTEPAKLSRLHERRAGLAGDESPGEGPHAPLRHGQRPGPRHPALPGRRGGRGPAAERGLPGEQVRPPAQGAGDRGESGAARRSWAGSWARRWGSSRPGGKSRSPAMRRRRRKRPFWPRPNASRNAMTHWAKRPNEQWNATQPWRSPIISWTAVTFCWPSPPTITASSRRPASAWTVSRPNIVAGNGAISPAGHGRNLYPLRAHERGDQRGVQPGRHAHPHRQ